MLSASDYAFLRNHARDYACSDERADAYADWYLARYAEGADTLADVPDHPSAWHEFLSSLT